MDRRSFVKTSALLTAAAATGCTGLMAEQSKRPPNVVLLFIDDLGYADTGPFGCADIPTPNIDRLAKEGTVLTQAYVTNPREEKNVAARFPKVVETMASRHAEWKRGHVPPPKIPKLNLKHKIPTGHGWVISDGRQGRWNPPAGPNRE